jgi:hypothetical protein
MTGTLALAGQRITASWLNLNIPGAWAPVTMQNSWVNEGGGAATFQCRQINSVILEIIGMIKSGSTGINTVIGTIPVAFAAPASNQGGQGYILAGTGGGNAFGISVLGNRNIILAATITGATDIGFHFSVSLDA